jgi:hypothetical protein
MRNLKANEIKRINTVKMVANNAIKEQRNTFKKQAKRENRRDVKALLNSWAADLQNITGSPTWFQVGDEKLLLDFQLVKSAIHKTRKFSPRTFEILGDELYIDYDIGYYAFKGQKWNHSCLEGLHIQDVPLLDNIPTIVLKGES